VAKAPIDIRSLARAHTERAIQTLQGIMDCPDAPPAARVKAAEVLLDRGWGKAEQHTTSETTVRYVARVPDKAKTTEQWKQQNSQPTAH
jgi:hypothetical protein